MGNIESIFGSMVFSDTVMRSLLPHDTYEKLQKTIQEGRDLDRGVADVVANAMKDWAIEKGATHYTPVSYTHLDVYKRQAEFVTMAMPFPDQAAAIDFFQ